MRRAISPPSAEAQFLFSCCHPRVEREPIKEPLDWQWILRWVLVHEMVPALFRRLQGGSFSPPQSISRFVADYSQAVETYCKSAWEQTAELRNSWNKAGVETLVLPQADSVNGAQQPRLSRFPEFFVKPEHLRPTIEILQTSGYALRRPATLASNFSALYTHFLFQGPAGAGLSLRWAVPGRQPVAKALDAIWQRSESAQTDLPCRFPSPTDAAMLHAMLGTESNWATLGTLREISYAMWPFLESGWEALLIRARELGCYRRLLFALALGESAGIMKLPAEIRRDIDKNVSGDAARIVFEGLFSIPATRSPLRNLLGDLQSLDSFGRRARYFSQFLFTPTEADLALSVPGAILRPFRLAAASVGFGRKVAENNLSSYVATPAEVVDQVLDLASVGPKDVVYDLGCGDGRIVIRAAEKYNARGVGVDLSGARIEEAVENSSQKNISHLARFELSDLNRINLREATVVFLALPALSLLEVGATLEKRVRPGTRIVSLGGDTGSWNAVQVTIGKAYPQPVFLRMS